MEICTTGIVKVAVRPRTILFKTLSSVIEQWRRCVQYIILSAI